MTPAKRGLLAAVVVGLALAAASPAIAAQTITDSRFAKEYDTAAHKYEIGVHQKPLLVTSGNTVTYFDPSGDREVAKTLPDGSEVITVCRAADSRGFMTCFLHQDGKWTPANMLDRPAKGWLGPLGDTLMAARVSQQALMAKTVEQQGSSQISKAVKPRVTRLTVTGTFPGLPATSETRAATFGPRTFTLTQRTTGQDSVTVTSATVVPKREIYFPNGGADLDHGWG